MDGTWRDIDPCNPRVIHASRDSKARALLTGVESGDFIDSEGNHVSVDADFARYELVKQALKIEMQKMENFQVNADYKAKENVARAFITRLEREEREEE